MKKLIAVLLCTLLLTSAAALAEDYTFGTDTAFRPFEYTDETGTLVGIDVELLAAIAEDQGFTQKDAMIAGASITEERKEKGWIFSDGYYTATQSMAVAAGSDITGFEGLSGKSVAVKTGTKSKDYADSLAGTYNFTVVTFESSPDIYQAVISGQCACRHGKRRCGLRYGHLQP